MLVEKSFVINLKIRPDRLESFMESYPENQHIPQPDVWDAIHGDTCVAPDNWNAGNGAWGCYKTHVNILEHCMNNGIGSYVVFEDDAVFPDNFCSQLDKFSNSLPEDWDQIYLGGQLIHEGSHPPIKVNDEVYRPFNVNRTHCFGVSRKGMLPIYRHISNLPFHAHEHIDHHLGRLHETYNINVYAPSRWMVGQGGSSSNVSGKTDPIRFFDDAVKVALDHKLFREPVCIVARVSSSAIKQCKPFIHIGNYLDNSGQDKGLSEAWKYVYPGPEISRWYSHIRSEIVRSDTNRLPCLWHPRITDEMIDNASVGKVILVDELDDAKAIESILDIVDEYYR